LTPPVLLFSRTLLGRLDLHLHACRRSIAVAQALVSSSSFSVLPPSCFSVALPW
jgi:hypothetical protein